MKERTFHTGHGVTSVCARGRKCAHSRKVHSREEDVHEDVPRVSLDYYFMNDKDRQNGSNPILIMIDESTGGKVLACSGQEGSGGRWRNGLAHKGHL